MALAPELCTDATSGRICPADAGPKPLQLSVIVPTFNERDNVRELVARLDDCLSGLAWEVMFVDDDSRDGTLDALRDLSRSDPRVRSIHRIGRRGLASAVVEGILATSAPIVAILDCDLQHDETLLPKMLEQVTAGNCDVVVASRYMASGSVGDWAKKRLLFSRTATWLAALLLRSELTDPMSGFFMIRRNAFDRVVRHLSNQGYKILLDILLSARPSLRVKEIPYTFRSRLHGESKLDSIAILDYLALLLDKTVGHVLPLRFITFAGVGCLGLVVHLAALAALNRGAGVTFATANLAAAMVAMTSNFFVNNLLTYRDMRLKGVGPMLRGLLSFYAVCSIGTLANVGIGDVLFQRNYAWWLAGMAGIFMGAVWNYTATSIFTWHNVGKTEELPLHDNDAIPLQPSADSSNLSTRLPV
jgi:dolichol-phosphate mannosyltransferase